MGAFDAELLTTTKIKQGETIEEQVHSLAMTGKLSSAGNDFCALVSMLYNVEYMLQKLEVRCKMKLKANEEEVQKKNQDRMSKYEATRRLYEENLCGVKLKSSDLKTLPMFICSEERKDNPSQFKTVKDMKNRLDNCKIPWQNYFMAIASAETSTEVDDGVLDLL